MRTRLTVFVVLALLGAVCVLPAAAQPSRPAALPAMDAATRAAVVDSLTATIDSVYVLGEPAARIVAGLRQNLADGAYDDITDPADFARRLETDAQAINHDGHFGIRALPPLDPAVAEAGQEEDPLEEERRARMMRAGNYGFRKAEILPGGIGYLRFDMFAHGDDAYEAGAAAMNFLANSNAVILDLRSNGGGSASMIRFLAGYLFAEKEHLINWEIRAENLTTQSYSADYVPGRRLLEQPVYVLTSGSTFSAAEEFTFDLRNLERATVVGDTTGGGGHTVAGYVYDFDGFRMMIRVPYGRAFNPENNEGWEGKGVLPHIAVPTEQALDAAHADALDKLMEAEEDEVIKGSYAWALKFLEARLNPQTLSAAEMEPYAGSFGPRRIFVADGALWYQREGRPRHRLQPLGDDQFKVGDLDYFMLEFGRDSDDRIDRVIGHYDNGRSDENPRDAG
jgi:hypothetical protein